MTRGCRSLFLGIIMLFGLAVVGYFIVNWLAEHPAWAAAIGVLVIVTITGVVGLASSLWTRSLMRTGAEMMVTYAGTQTQRDKAASSILSSTSRILGRFNAPPQLESGIGWEQEFPPIVKDAQYQEVKPDIDDFMA